MAPDTSVIEKFGNIAKRDIEQRLEEIEAERLSLEEQLRAWEVILASVKPQEGPVSVQSPVFTAPQPPVFRMPPNPSEKVREAIANTGKDGFLPKDITRELESAGIDVPKGFVNSHVFRMKKRQEIVEHEGRYYKPDFFAAKVFTPAPAEGGMQTIPYPIRPLNAQ